MILKVAFFILRLIIAIGALAVLAGTLAAFLFENFIGLVKVVAKVLVAVVTTFASAFQKSPGAPGPSVAFSPVLMGIAITFMAIFASVFTPGQRIFLHIVAVMAIGAAAWDIHRSTTSATHETLFLPVIVVWFVYYVICLRRA